MLNHLFTTPLWQKRLSPPPEEFAALREYLLGLRAATPGEHHSNRGGWHSSGNLFAQSHHRQFAFLNAMLKAAVFEYFRTAFGFEGEMVFSLTGWAVINEAGHVNVPHNHPGHLLSGVFYVSVPEAMQDGELVFMDPRLNVNAFASDTMRRLDLRPTWDASNVLYAPGTGDLVLFPAWLLHYVNAFTAPQPGAVRMVISFNVAV